MTAAAHIKDKKDPDAIYARSSQTLCELFKRARQKALARAIAQKRNYDLRAEPKELKDGDAAHLRHPAAKEGCARKQPWKGPLKNRRRMSAQSAEAGSIDDVKIKPMVIV